MAFDTEIFAKLENQTATHIIVSLYDDDGKVRRSQGVASISQLDAWLNEQATCTDTVELTWIFGNQQETLSCRVHRMHLDTVRRPLKLRKLDVRLAIGHKLITQFPVERASIPRRAFRRPVRFSSRVRRYPQRDKKLVAA